MLKSLITMLCALFLLICANFLEQITVQKTFDEFYQIIEATQSKLQGENPTLSDSESLEDFWLDKKRNLHVWIPHTEIKEIDLWVSECVAYTRLGQFDEAITKLDVLKVLASQIPHNFSLLLENLF
ncbi:MAG: DUF4363 family protein [Clostridia bacterium]|nr:DUF4363 family protein [Clostridia bacterium]